MLEQKNLLVFVAGIGTFEFIYVSRTHAHTCSIECIQLTDLATRGAHDREQLSVGAHIKCGYSGIKGRNNQRPTEPAAQERCKTMTRCHSFMNFMIFT